MQNGKPAISDDEWRATFYPYADAHARLHNVNNSFTVGTIIPAGTTLEIQKTETRLNHGKWFETVIYLKNTSWNENQIHRIYFVGSNGGKAPATIEEFVAAAKGHLELVLAGHGQTN